MKDRIKLLRSDLGLTQQQFADRIGIKRNTIATYETGRSEPVGSIVSLICREFGVSEQWLRTGEGEIYERASDKELELVEMFGAILREKGGESFEMQTIAAMMKFGQREWEALHIVLQYINSLDDDPKEKTPEE